MPEPGAGAGVGAGAPPRAADADGAVATGPGEALLRQGAARALLRPRAGGRIAELVLQADDGRAVPVLFAYPEAGVDAVDWAKGGLYPLLPYSNRIAQARLDTPTGEVALAAHPQAQGHTLHGNAHTLPWQLVALADAAATMALDCPRSAAWPWRYHARFEAELATPHTLSLGLLLRNDDQRPMPAGLGWHPYLLHRPDALLRCSADRRWHPTPDGLVVGHGPVPPALSFARAMALPAGGLTEHLSGWDGRLSVGLPSGDVLLLRTGAPVGHLVLHRPPDARYLCVEPVSHVVDGFNLQARGVMGTGTQWLAPGQALAARLDLTLDSRPRSG